MWTLCILQTAIWNFLRPRDIPTQDVDTTRRTGRVEVIMDDILVPDWGDGIKPDPERVEASTGTVTSEQR